MYVLSLFHVSIETDLDWRLTQMLIVNVSRAIRKRFSNIREPEESPYIQKRSYRF
jgi:hypothetical protein